MYKGILLDIDNTLYTYEPLHQLGMASVLQYAQTQFGINKEQALNAFNQAKSWVKVTTPEVAQSHNRLLYMQRFCEMLNVNPLTHALPLYNAYWDTFLHQLQLSAGAKTFLQRYQHVPVCLVTDLTAHIQYRKIEKLGLTGWVSKMVTSEEAGHEKPHPFMFQHALFKLGLKPGEVCMVGDSYKKDVQGANALGIHAYWLSDEKIPANNNLVTQVSDLRDIQF